MVREPSFASSVVTATSFHDDHPAYIVPSTRNANSGEPFFMNSVPSAVLYDWPISRPPRTSSRRVTNPDATSRVFPSTGAANASKAKAWHSNTATAALQICFLMFIFTCPFTVALAGSLF